MKLQILTRRKIYLAEDIILEILLRLPAESLLKFKVVCKQWYKLISSPDFRSTHLSYLLNHHPHRQIIFPTKNVTPDGTVEFNHLSINSLDHNNDNGFKQIQFHLEESNVTLESTCNGLFLLQSDSRFCTFQKLYVYNPVTRQSIELCIPFGSFLWSLVYNVSAQRYQIVAVCRDGFTCCALTLQSHELGTNWEFIWMPFRGYPVAVQPIIYVNNQLYWLAQLDETLAPFIVAMSLVAKEEFRQIDCPPGLDRPGRNPRQSLFEMKGFLCLTDTISLDILDVWVLVDEDKWSRYYSMNLKSVGNGPFYPCVFGFSPFMEGSNIEDISIIYKNQLVLYNTKSRMPRLMFDGDNKTTILTAYPHVNSLASWE